MAAVIMLVSLFAGIVVPASAESGSAILTKLQTKYNALQQEDFAEVREETVAGMRETIANLIEQYEGAYADYEREILDNIGIQADQDFVACNKGNLISDLAPRYLLKDYYKELGYEAASETYYIVDEEDWSAAAASGSLFTETTLLVANDIDFKGQKVEPLTANDMPFQGVLDGQGHTFKNMIIEIGDTDAEGTYKYGGLVADLTGTIKNLGLDGGEVNFAGYNSGKNEGVGSFAGHISGNGLLQNCWSTMTVSNKGSAIKDGKNGVSGLIGWGEGGAIDNCFFSGVVNNIGDSRAATDLIYVETGTKVYNSIAAGTLNCDETRNPAAMGVLVKMYQATENFSIYNTYAVGKNTVRHRDNANPYSAGSAGNNYVKYPDTDITFTKDITHKFTPEATNDAYMIDSVKEAAWAVNDRFDTTHQSAYREYIISVDDNGELYMAKNEGAYRKVTFEGSASGVYYFREGAKVHLINDLNMLFADSITLDKKEFSSALDGYVLTVPAGDIVVTINYSPDSAVDYYATELTKRVEKYEKIDFALFDCEQALNDWLQASKAELAKSEKDAEMLKFLVELESGEEGFANIMGFLPGKYPSPKDYEAYQDFNKTKEWAVTEKADWLAMVELSKTYTFEGDTFYILNNIDFGDERMDPLSFDQEVPFQGTIEGRGNVFENINIKFAASGEDATIVTEDEVCAGMIGALGEGAIIRNFGVESGTIASGRDNMQLSTFGCPQSDANVTLEKVWSGVQISATGASTEVAGLVANPSESSLVINGGYFFGSVAGTGTAGQANFAIAGDDTQNNAVYNTIGAPTNPDKIDASMRWTEANLKGLANNYAVGYSTVYLYDAGKEMPGIGNTNVTTETVIEAAYKINQSSVGVKDFEGSEIKAVYFTLKDGKIAFGADDGSDQIRKITFAKQGVFMGEMYAAAGSTVKLVCDAAISFDSISSGNSSIFNAAAEELTLGNEDVTIQISIDEEKALPVQLSLVQNLLKKYENLDPELFANGADMIAWKEQAQKAVNDEDLVALLLAVEKEAKMAQTTEFKENCWPTYTQYEQYKEINKNNEWLIASKADWDAMDAYAKAAAAGTYFDGFTFHLNKDVDFGNVPMLPLGAKEGRLFAGTIDGHGFGFKNINILVTGDDLSGYYANNKMVGSVGLIAFLEKCEIRDFGIYSGTIETQTSSGSGCSLSTFGTVPENTKATAPTFTRVWSGVTLKTTRAHPHFNALVGTFNNKRGTRVKVNGFVFYGEINADRTGNAANLAYGVIGGNQAAPHVDSEFSNIITYPTESCTLALSTYLFNFGNVSNFEKMMNEGRITNVYGLTKNGDVGLEFDYRDNVQKYDATTIGGVVANPSNLTTMSAEEAAMTINSKQPVTDKEAVYFTLKDGNLIPTGDAEKQLRRIVVMAGGEVVETLYGAPGDKITLNVSTECKLTEGTLSTLNGNELTLGNENVVVTATACAHTNIKYIFVEGTKTHIVHCDDCGKDLENNDCELGSWSADEGEALTHSATCSLCNGVQTEDCVATLVPNTTDCTLDGIYTFDCCNRADTSAPGTGKTQHTFNGNWTDDDAPLGKEIDKCEFCDVKLVRTPGKVNVSSDNLVAAGGEVDVVITLPNALNSANIKITPAEDSKYTIQSVVAENVTMEGLAEQDGAYTATLANVQAGATITVNVKVEKFGFVADGMLDVEITNATDAEGEVTDAYAQADITFARVSGDANADGNLSIDDPLAVLQYNAGYPVQVHIANADMDFDGDVDPNDAVQIIRAWMLTI